MYGSNFDIFEAMKRLVYILALLPLAAFGQYDFETRYFTIDAEALPQVEESSALTANYNFTPSSRLTLSSFRMNASNYRKPVDMMTALNKQTEFIDKKFDVAPLQQKTFGFSVSVSGSNSFDNTSNTGIRNIAYKEMRSVYFCSPSGNYSAYGRRY